MRNQPKNRSVADHAIKLDSLSKTYRLYSSQTDQLIEVLGLRRLGLKPRKEPKLFSALRNVSLEVPTGGRVGIVGRNGAGKTTLLKLICGNFAPTSGSISVNGTVQALLVAGNGFNPEYGGRENVEASLQYNGLSRSDYDEAIADIEEFCELGDFFEQPFKTYSAGMQARLMFAAATAVKPDVLIVDEVLGAGDAYFIAKSKRRVEAMVNNGCSMLLVSHSMPQVLELCEKAIWMDAGEVRMEGDSFDVVKAYEAYLHGTITSHSLPSSAASNSTASPHAEENTDTEHSDQLDLSESSSELNAASAHASGLSEEHLGALPDAVFETLQEPRFWPNAAPIALPSVKPPRDFKFVARGGITQWESVEGLKLIGATIVAEGGETNQLISMRPAKVVFTVQAERSDTFDCRYGVVLYDHLGRCKLDGLSGCDTFTIKKGEVRMIEMVLNPLQLGPDEYTMSLSVHAYDRLEVFNGTPRYDLLSRSFDLTVTLPDSLRPIEAEFYHSAQWNFDGAADGTR